MESTSPGFAVELGAAALGADDFDEEAEGCVAGFWALAHKEPRAKQSVITAATSFLIANNLTRTHPGPQTGTEIPPFAGVSTLADIGAHWCFFIWMLPLPPLQIVQVAAERDGCALHGGNGDPIGDGCPTLVADSSLGELWGNQPVPGNAPVPLLINAGRIDRANGVASARVPVLAVDPVVSQYGDAAYLAE